MTRHSGFCMAIDRIPALIITKPERMMGKQMKNVATATGIGVILMLVGKVIIIVDGNIAIFNWLAK